MTEQTVNLIKDKILKVLEIYPRVSPSMLQIGIGSSLSPSIWRPVLDELIQQGIVVQDDLIALSASDRQQHYKIIQLASNQEQVITDERQ